MKPRKDKIDADLALVENGTFLVKCDDPSDEEFCRLVASGMSPSAAAGQTGSSYAHGHERAKKPALTARINYLRHTACEAVALTLDGILAELLILKEAAWQRKDHKTVQSLLNDIARLGGFDEQRNTVPRMSMKEIVETMAEAKGLSMEQMRAVARAEAAKRHADLPPPHKFH